MRVGIAVGHSTGRPGAEVGVETIHTSEGKQGCKSKREICIHWAGSGIFEYTLMSIFSCAIARELAISYPDVEIRIFYRDPNIKTHDARRLDVVARVNEWGPDLVIETHANAMPVGKKGKKRGPEGLHYPGSNKGFQAATKLAKTLANAHSVFSERDVPYRIRRQTKSWSKVAYQDNLTGKIFSKPSLDRRPVPNGSELYILTKTRAPAVILETFFTDTPDDYNSYQAALLAGVSPRYIATAIAELLKSWEV